MQTINEHVNSGMTKLVENSKKTTDEQHRATSLNDAKRAKVFLAFKYYYGILWLNQFESSEKEKEVLKRMWASALSDLSVQSVEAGIKKIVMGLSKFSTYPPKAGEFAELSRLDNSPRVPEFKSLPEPKADKEKARSCIAEMRKKLGMSNV